jgi:Domain of unknown function (DUF222)
MGPIAVEATHDIVGKPRNPLVDNGFLSVVIGRIEDMFEPHFNDRDESIDAAPQTEVAREADVDAVVDARVDAIGDVRADALGDGESDEVDTTSDGAETTSDEADEALAAAAADAVADAAAVDGLVAQIRADTAEMGAAEARRLRHLAELTLHLEGEAVAMLASTPRVPGAPQDHEVIDSAVDGEVQVVLGIGPGPAARLVHLARRLTTAMPQALDALESGQLDMPRLRALVAATEVLSAPLARDVADQMLEVAGKAPWEGMSPRAWRARIDRTVVRVDADAVRRRRREAYEARLVRALPTIAGMAELFITADAADVAMAVQVLTDLANGREATGPDGDYLTMDQRRVDAFVDLFQRVRDGRDLPEVPVRRERELGLVMHADTFFEDGPAAGDAGEVRGLGQTAHVDPFTAREQAQGLVGTTGASTSSGGVGRTSGITAGSAAGSGAVNVLLVDRMGALVRMVRVTKAPPGGWTRALLEAAVAAKLSNLPALSCPGHDPTVAIQEHVRARNPRCTGYDCPRKAARCDLDHDTAYPRGPTDVNNLDPRCRRHHEHKTRGLVRTRLHSDGAVETTMMLTGLVITTRPEPLPGHAPGEGRATAA